MVGNAGVTARTRDLMELQPLPSHWPALGLCLEEEGPNYILTVFI